MTDVVRAVDENGWYAEHRGHGPMFDSTLLLTPLGACYQLTCICHEVFLALPATVPPSPLPRCGDTVHHHPTRERLVVAYADLDRDELAWFGWPDGRVRLSACALLHRVSDVGHVSVVQMWRGARVVQGDTRRANVLRRYGTPEERQL